MNINTLRQQLEEMLAQGFFEQALIAYYAALQLAPLDEKLLLGCAELFVKLQCEDEAKALYLVCLFLKSENKESVKRLRQLQDRSLVSPLAGRKSQYIEKIGKLVNGAMTVAGKDFLERRSMSEWLAGNSFWGAIYFLKFCLSQSDLDYRKKIIDELGEAFSNLFPHRSDIHNLHYGKRCVLSALRSSVVAFYIDYVESMFESEFEVDVFPSEKLISALFEVEIWKLGCFDCLDFDLLGRIVNKFNAFVPGVFTEQFQFLISLALALFRSPFRVCKSMDSDAIFLSYLNVLQERVPQLEGNVYRSRVLASYSLPQERLLWFIENFSGISKFRNKHVGESCYIIGNGPSLKRMNLQPLRNKITFGLNKIYLLFEKLGFETSYLVAANAFVLQQSGAEFSGLSMPQFFMMWGREFVEKRKNVLFLREKKHGFFSTDITKGVVVDCTVTHMALQLAFFMGFKTVILIGVDHSFVSQGKPHATVTLPGEDPNHFDPNYFGHGVPWQLPDLKGSERAYKGAKKIFEEDGRQILDATVDGKLQIFPKIEYRKSLEIV